MAKKKENPPVEEKKTGEAEKAAKTAAENEIPESVTLTRDEFKQVNERIDQLATLRCCSGCRQTLTTIAAGMLP